MTTIVLMVMTFAPAPQGAGAPAANPCVTCHEALPAPEAVAHSFVEWRASPHGSSVTCDRCHGGDTTTTDQEAAHKGVLPANDYRSVINVTRIPATCGSCHQQELGFFIGSRHAGQLRTGHGPNCVTCHGSMAVHILRPAEVDSACGACHVAGGRAAAAVIDTARALLVHLGQTDSTRRAAETAAEQITNARQQTRVRARLAEAKQLIQRSRQGWHAFDLAAVRDLLNRADSLMALPVRRE
jgi:hypothetical protein